MSRRISHRPGGNYVFTAIAVVGAFCAAGCTRPAPAPIAKTSIVGAISSTTQATTPAATGPAIVYTHLVTSDTAIILRGASDDDVKFDTIYAGTRVRAIGAADAYLRVVVADGRDGLVARERLQEIPRPPAVVKDVAEPNQNPLPPPPADGPTDYATYWPGNVPAADCPSPVQIESAIDRAKKYLYTRQINGTWDAPVAVAGAPAMANTTLVLNAMLYAVESDSSSGLSAALKKVEANVPGDTFTAAWRSQLQNIVSRRHEKSFTVGDNLISAAGRPGTKPAGLFGPGADGDNFDVLSTYHGVWGLKNMSDAGIEIPVTIWMDAAKALQRRQLANGGWDAGSNGQKAGETFLATAAGFLALQTIDDALPDSALAQCRGSREDANMAAAIRRLNQYLKQPIPNSPPCETAYWIERIGDSTGRKYLGGQDWFSEFARNLIDNQKPDGSWADDVRETAFGLMFLRRGNAPIFVNKLAYTSGGGKSAWNERPADVSHLVAWVGAKECESEANWQIVSIDAPVEDWLEAPILCICGNRALNFDDAQIAKLRDYVNRGGLIFGNADCASREFGESFKSLGEKIFPQYEFRPLPADHLIFNEMFRATKWRTKPKVLAMSNGVRELMVLLSNTDAARNWQERTFAAGEPSFQFGTNLILYATGRQFYISKADRRAAKVK